jgi:hypothetical protein
MGVLCSASPSSFENALGAAGFGASVGDAVVGAIEADDEHRATVHIAAGLVGGDVGDVVAARGGVAYAFAEAAAAELVGAAEEVDGVVGAVGGDAGFHGAEMFVTEREDVRPHALRECSRRGTQVAGWASVGGELRLAKKL